ncbi:CHAP domain-containing protein [Cellulomonas iranensis]|uniref:CHAP domain-containing protein n=1 Tax=Cellulomonas iranensis TaxID=76862 RepID=UPI001CF53C03|nr:CHAP domain-containing protein [Cellulomonas iranensis]UCN15288.1 CHAP domain-containing protein [Cellulomonas iranensis]
MKISVRSVLAVIGTVGLLLAAAGPASAAHQPMPDGWSAANPASGWTRSWGYVDSTLAYSGFSGGARTTSYWGQALCTGGYNCTNYVAYRLQRNGAPDFVRGCATGSNATSWDERARRCGVRVDATAAPGAVLQWDASAYGNSAGHVAYVDAVFGDSILVSQAGCSGGASREVLSLAALRARGLGSGGVEFIHPRDLPNPGGGTPQAPTAPTAGTAFEAASNNSWLNLDPGTITGATDVAAMTVGDTKYIYTIIGGQVYEAASNNGWKNLPTGIAGAEAVAVTNMNGVKYVYTLKNGEAWEAASDNGWRDLPLGSVAGATDIAATSMGGVKFVYTLIGGTVHEAASNNGWRNLSTGGVTGASRVAAMAVDGVKFVYSIVGGVVYEAASDNGWRNASTDQVVGASELAVASVGTTKFVYTLVGGTAYEAASDNAWRNLSTGNVTGAFALAAASTPDGVKLIYSLR